MIGDLPEYMGGLKFTIERKHVELIRELRTHNSLPCLCGGDLNEIFYHHEKKGGRSRHQKFLDEFHGLYIG